MVYQQEQRLQRDVQALSLTQVTLDKTLRPALVRRHSINPRNQSNNHPNSNSRSSNFDNQSTEGDQPSGDLEEELLKELAELRRFKQRIYINRVVNNPVTPLKLISNDSNDSSIPCLSKKSHDISTNTKSRSTSMLVETNNLGKRMIPQTLENRDASGSCQSNSKNVPQDIATLQVRT